MIDKQELDAKILNTLKQLKENNSAFSDLPEIHRLREQLNECVKYYGK
jgi:hypothetical protein